VQDARLMRRALEYASGLTPFAGGRTVTLAQHCEVKALADGGYLHEGAWSSTLGIPGQPSEAESLMVARDIALAKRTGARVHFQHLSCADSVALVRAAKAAGLPVTAEATPHHFCLTDACCASYDTVFKVHPPLRTDADVAAIREGLLDGTIDAIATDHAPHTAQDKELPFDQASPGMLGLETAFALANTELGLPIERLLALLSWQPAAIAGIGDRHGCAIVAGAPANLAVIDPNLEWIVRGNAMASRSRNTPFEGRTVRGRVRHTILSGDVVVDGGEVQR
jgi:dihydroorotase